jgi:5'-nucleotidase
MTKRIFIDMDGVITNFAKAAKEQGNNKRPDLYVDYRNLDIMPGAVEAVYTLNKDFDVFIASTPPWTRPEVWGHKKEWLEDYFPYLKRKLILTHRKDLLIGDILIDDTKYRGQPDFKGKWYWFTGTNANWKKCLDWVYTLK